MSTVINGEYAEATPYLLDVQSDLLQGLETRIVVSLRRCDRFPVVNLTPTFEIKGVKCLLETPKPALCAASFIENTRHIACIQPV